MIAKVPNTKPAWISVSVRPGLKGIVLEQHGVSLDCGIGGNCERQMHRLRHQVRAIPGRASGLIRLALSLVQGQAVSIRRDSRRRHGRVR